MKVSEMLIKAKALIENEANWIQGQYARETPNGKTLSPRDGRAKCFCAIGALRHVDGATGHGDGVLMKAAEVLAKFAGAESADTHSGRVMKFNDRASHADVLAMFDKAIAEAQKAEQE